MKKNGKRELFIGITSVAIFIVWTVLVQTVDVQSVGQNGTDVGFATWNARFHDLTGVHMGIYILTDWLGLMPLFVCMIFAGMGFVQLINRRSLFKVDYDIVFLGIYYVVVILCYLLFEMFPINYRPILIYGVMEASYPSSTTLLVLSVMPTLTFQVKRRLKNAVITKRISVLIRIFSWSMVIGRLISGVHWFTDIVGSVMLSVGLFCLYKATVSLRCKKG
nr:phosphatase PAP2 family protein [Lachnospiraceae bacterium]